MTLSQRGASLAAPLPEMDYISAFTRVMDNLWHPTRNPDGIVQFAVAENVHTWATLEPSMRLHVADQGFDESVPHYGDFSGHPRFRAALLQFMRRHVFADRGTPLPDDAIACTPDHILVTNGCGPALEHLTFALCDPGDAILTAAPIYAGFLMDVGRRAQARLLAAPMDPDRGFRLDTEVLDAALAEARASNVRVRALLLCQPFNPIGRCLEHEEVEQAVHWCERHELHLISDEIYAASVFAPEASFTSAMAFASRRADWATSHLHIIYGMSKDFGLSGFRVGVICTQSPELHEALDGVSYFCGCSSLPQYLLTALLEDQARVDAYLADNRQRLHRLYRSIAGGADAFGIPYVPADSGFFVWLDLRRWLAEPTPAAENELWTALLDGARVFLTPGLSCRAPAPGMFRLCFAAAPAGATEVGMQRIGRFLQARAMWSGRDR
jgi:aspartate/methionine/tyrosine aminotransferase